MAQNNNSLRPSYAIWLQILVIFEIQVMAYQLGTKPLPKPMMTLPEVADFNFQSISAQHVQLYQ